MFNQQSELFSDMDSCIEPLVMRVLQFDYDETYFNRIDVVSVSSSCGSKKDRLKLSVPYARHSLTWDIFFDSQCPEMGPDFIFNDDTFLADIDVDTLSLKVPSLAEWNPNDNDALLNVLMELLSCYKQHQIELLQKQNKLQIEYSMLKKSTEVETENIEVILLPLGGSKPVEAKFSIWFSIDLSQLPNHDCEPENNKAMLLVTFNGADWNRIVPELCLSKYLEEILGGKGEINLPPFPLDKFLIDYIPEIKKLISEKINTLVHCVEQKRKFITAMLCFQYSSIIEYDPIDYRYIALLLCERNVTVLMRCELSSRFPREKPKITLHSTYHVTEEKAPYTEVLENYSYDNKSDIQNMVQEILSYIKAYIPEFISNRFRNRSL